MKASKENNQATKGSRKFKSVGLFLAGALVGAVLGSAATLAFSVQPYNDVLANRYVSDAMNDTHTATRLRQGQHTEIVKRIEMDLPNKVLILASSYQNHPMSSKALQNIKSYYQKNNIPVPPDIQPFLNELPN